MNDHCLMMRSEDAPVFVGAHERFDRYPQARPSINGFFRRCQQKNSRQRAVGSGQLIIRERPLVNSMPIQITTNALLTAFRLVFHCLPPTALCLLSVDSVERKVEYYCRFVWGGACRRAVERRADLFGCWSV